MTGNASDAIRQSVRLKSMIETLNLIAWIKDEENTLLAKKVAERRAAAHLTIGTGLLNIRGSSTPSRSNASRTASSLIPLQLLWRKAGNSATTRLATAPSLPLWSKVSSSKTTKAKSSTAVLALVEFSVLRKMKSTDGSPPSPPGTPSARTVALKNEPVHSQRPHGPRQRRGPPLRTRGRRARSPAARRSRQLVVGHPNRHSPLVRRTLPDHGARSESAGPVLPRSVGPYSTKPCARSSRPANSNSPPKKALSPAAVK